MKVKRYVSILLTLIIMIGLLNLPGCWDSRDIEELAMVIGIGIDQEEMGDQYLITFQIARPEALGGGEMGAIEGNGGGGQATWNMTVNADSVFDAVRKARQISPRELFFGHTQVVVLGEGLATHGVGPVMDFLQRETDLRRTIDIVVAKGEAKGILEGEAIMEEMSAIGLIKQISLQDTFSLLYTEIMGNFVADLDNPTAAALAPGAARMRNAPDDEELKKVGLEETAVFKGDKLVAWLTELESRGVMWARDRIIDGVIIFKDPVEEIHLVNIQVTRARTDVDVRLEDNIPVFTIKVEGEGRLASHTSPHEMLDPDNYSAMEKRAANTIRDRIHKAVARAKELEADFLGLGGQVSKKLPRYWKEVEDDWEEILPDVRVEIDAQFKIRKTGLIIRPIRF